MTSPADPWPARRRLAVAAWAGGTSAYLLVLGIPFDRAPQLLMIVTGALAFGVGTDRRANRVFADWIPFFALFYGYDYSRGAADTFGRHVNVVPVFNAERDLFGWMTGGEIPSVWLQRTLYDQTAVQWWEGIVTLVYCTHFVLPWAIVGVLYVRGRELWARFTRRVIAISLAALVTYYLYPAAPPWYAARMGLSEDIARISSRGWEVLNLHIAGQLLQTGQGVVNQVAAVPSLHAGMTVTIVLFFWGMWRKPWQRAVLVVYPLVMVFALVYGGEHYVVDALLGWLYAVVVEWGCRLWERAAGRKQVAPSAMAGVS